MTKRKVVLMMTMIHFDNDDNDAGSVDYSNKIDDLGDNVGAPISIYIKTIHLNPFIIIILI